MLYELQINNNHTCTNMLLYHTHTYIHTYLCHIPSKLSIIAHTLKFLQILLPGVYGFLEICYLIIKSKPLLMDTECVYLIVYVLRSVKFTGLQIQSHG